MKKFFASMLALAAIAGFAPTASAQDEEPLIQFFVHGQPVKNGDRIDITNYFNAGRNQYEPELTCLPSATDDMYVKISIENNETTPLDENWYYGASVGGQFCGFNGSCVPFDEARPYENSGEVEAGKELDMQLHAALDLGDEQTYEDLKVKFEILFEAQFDEEEIVLTFFVDKPDAAGVEGIDADNNAATVYYDLHGRQVANPSNGLYIVKQGSKVTKAFIR